MNAATKTNTRPPSDDVLAGVARVAAPAFSGRSGTYALCMACDTPCKRLDRNSTCGCTRTTDQQDQT